MKNMEIQMQTLSRDLETAKEKVVLLERDVDFGELQRLKLEEKLQKNQRRCEELEETVTRLLEEKKVSADREKRAEELCHKISSENSKMAYEFNSSISELKETIRELKDKKLESDRLAGVFQERYKRFDTMVVKMDQEIEDLRREKSAANETIEELRCENLEAKKTVDELRLEKLESDKVADVCKSKLEDLRPRMKKIEKNLADMLVMNVGDRGNFADSLRKLATNSGDFPDFKVKDDDDDDSKGKGAENGVIMSTSNSKKGDKNSDQPCSRGEDHDAHNTVKTSCDSQIGRNSPKPENNGCKEPPGLGAHVSGTQFVSGEGCFSKITCSSSVAGDIIMISDSDDEAKPIGAVNISNVGENQIKIIQSPLSSQRGKRSRTEDLFANSTTGGKGTYTQAMRKSGCALAEYMVVDNVELRRKESVGSGIKKTET